jgi:NAD(P)-dependent dehydrogenase (short-subunit alcohol dehydrogenase family)
MTDQAEQVSTARLVDTKQRAGATKRRQFSEALKRQIVGETLEPGSSVSIVARRHDVNSNQLFKWRRELLPKAVVESGAMVPVAVAPDGGCTAARMQRLGIQTGAFDRICAINLRGTIMACKHVLPIMRLQRSGYIINISSVGAPQGREEAREPARGLALLEQRWRFRYPACQPVLDARRNCSPYFAIRNQVLPV